MKVLIVNGSSVFDNLAGSEMQMRSIGRYLIEQGHSVVYYFRQCSPDKPPSESRDGATVYENLRPHGEWLGPLRDARRLESIVRNEAPDLLFSRCIRSLFVMGWASFRTGVPFVYQVPFSLAPSFFGLGQLTCLRKSVPLTIYGFFSRCALKHASRLLTISDDDAAFLGSFLGLHATTIYNMHPVPDAPAKKDYPPIVVWINNIKTVKRPEMFIELAIRCADTGVRFVMSGLMPTNRYGRQIRRQIEVARNLEYIGPTTLAEANDLLARATVNVVNSESEGFGNGNIQGWFRETPTITTVDKDQVIARNMIGFHVSSADEMEEKLRLLLNNPEECAAMGRRAHQYAVKNHSIELQGPKYLRVFESVCGAHADTKRRSE